MMPCASGDDRECGDNDSGAVSCGAGARMRRKAGDRMGMIRRLLTGAIAAIVVGSTQAFGHNNKGDIQVYVNVPKEAELGKSVILECDWKLSGNNSLYSVKWYKDEHEFFSYNPSNELGDRIKIHPRKGVNIDMRSSNENKIRLTHLTLNSSAQYKCEVSADAPYFATNYLVGNLTVIALPNEGPQIIGLSSQYAVGENVTANCTAWPSVPKARLEWTINNKTVPPKYIVEHPPYKPINSQGTPNSVGLRFQIDASHFAGSSGTLRVRCLAYVGSRRYDVERHAQMTQANKQRYSAGDMRSGSAICVASTLLTVLAALVIT